MHGDHPIALARLADTGQYQFTICRLTTTGPMIYNQIPETVHSLQKTGYQTNMTPWQTDGSELLQELKLCETGVWDALVRGDMKTDEAALDDNFLGVYSDGFAEKMDHVQQLADGPTITSYQLMDLRVLPMGNDHAVLCYRTEFLRNQKTEIEAMYVSSIWRRSEPGWINVFSQDTPAID